ncbi:UDP-N-acetylmuramate dehydrogenase [Candidatus Methylacidithermus pantelleriae]|uniref:UDP-N-acetylenolpyruvoylglucosamine reductase n=1 Tax=Candidatus Methylacidithermus pantelleriae TaxID=2744239 RepID=A0A8J2BM82_9BACT|nr:UDP-N-acetylmuramate dehydrogenase [Candidatus Methylacidithermus pantelleriae]CAF0705207.1 UDP-N-acetylenolpyruvoylglucosamine reductase [Candidatus Methylacidithermus pantelleriae]
MAPATEGCCQEKRIGADCFPKVEIQENVPLKDWTSLGVGGPARFFVRAKTQEEILEAVRWATKRRLPIFVLGGGTNVLFSDRGFDGLVVHMALRGIRRYSEGEHLIYEVAAGEPWDDFVAQAVEEGAAGVECLSGIPGTAGATPVQNVGAYGQETSQTLLDLEVLDLEKGQTRWMKASECEFGYRRSVFNTVARGRYVILRLRFTLVPGGIPTVAYPEVQHHLRSVGRPLSLREVRKAVLAIRRRKGMLLESPQNSYRSAGSFFKNPCLTQEEFCRLAKLCQKEGLGDPPSFPLATGELKVPAAWLVERAGFCKGHREGRVGISQHHALALINLGDARAADLFELKERIEKAVFDRFGVRLEPEPVLVGW